MFKPEIRKKVSDTLKSIGHKPVIQGGNGRGPTRHEALMLKLLGQSWLWNYVIILNRHPYKIDLANPDLKIAIEVDGPSHGSMKVKLADRKKVAWLEELGWKVLRFKNSEVESLTTCKLKSILPIA